MSATESNTSEHTRIAYAELLGVLTEMLDWYEPDRNEVAALGGYPDAYRRAKILTELLHAGIPAGAASKVLDYERDIDSLEVVFSAAAHGARWRVTADLGRAGRITLLNCNSQCGAEKAARIIANVVKVSLR